MVRANRLANNKKEKQNIERKNRKKVWKKEDTGLDYCLQIVKNVK